MTIERQKATRRLRQAEKVFQEDSTVENQRTVENYTLDLYYTTHFPLTEKYIALYPKSETESQEVLDKRDRIRKELKEEMLYGNKKSSGSNTVELGSRKFKQKGMHEGMEGDEEYTENDSHEEIEEDEFLDLGHRKR